MKKIPGIMTIVYLTAVLLSLTSPLKAGITPAPSGRGFMGIDVSGVTLSDQDRLGLSSTQGVMVTKVVPGSPADSCGIRIDDLIVRMDAVPIQNKSSFGDLLPAYHPGSTAIIEIVRQNDWLVFSLTLSARPVPSASGKLSWSEAKALRIDELLDVIDSNNKSMGSLAIADSQQIIYGKALGYRYMDDAGRISADPGTRYRIGSITKTFTAVMIFQMIEEGKLALDTTLDVFFPAIQHADSITIAMMLTHKSGIFSFTDLPGYLKWSLLPRTHEEIIARICSEAPAFKPGARHEYSNSNYLLLGYIIEILDGRDYAASLNERITRKIGLKDTRYGGAIDVNNNEAMSYHYMGYWEAAPMMNMDVPGGAGGIVSTASDLVHFAGALFRAELISEQSLNAMLECEDGFGSGIFTLPMGSHVYFGHTGSIDGFSSILLVSPEDGLAICWLCNGEADPSLGLMGLISRILSDIHVDNPQYVKAEQLVDVATLTGTYSNDEIAMRIEIQTADGELYAQAVDQPAIRLEAIDGKTFECASIGLTIRFDTSAQTFTLKQDGATLLFTRETLSE